MIFFNRIKSFLFRLDYLKIHKSKYLYKYIYLICFKIVNLCRWVVSFFIKKKANNLNDFFKRIGIIWYGGNEGHTQQVKRETDFLEKQSRSKTKILEIGFNGGHSSETFLNSNSSLTVDSIDIGYHHYVNFGKYYLKKRFTKRFNLHIGESRKVLPDLLKKELIFDLIFIDGSHEYKDVITDLEICSKLSDKDTLVILDDVYYEKDKDGLSSVDNHNLGPTKAWNEFKLKNLVIEDGYIEFETENTNKRSIVYGKFTF